MNILLTGYKGFIGSHMLTSLQNAGHNVTTHEWGETKDIRDAIRFAIKASAITVQHLGNYAPCLEEIK